MRTKEREYGETALMFLLVCYVSIILSSNFIFSPPVLPKKLGKRWKFNFSGLNKYVDFSILFGSILHSPKDANDIDILNLVNKNNFTKVNSAILKIQNSLAKDVHSTNLTKRELKKELEIYNKAILDAVRKGIVLFGQKNFVKFIRSMEK